MRGIITSIYPTKLDNSLYASPATSYKSLSGRASMIIQARELRSETMPEPKKAAKKATTKKAAPSPKKAAKVQGTHRDHDLPWCDKKVVLFQTLKALKATSATSAKGSKEIVEKSNGTLTPRDVRHYSYHAKAAGLIDLADLEGMTGYAYHLTAKGAKVDPVAELKKQTTAK